MTTTHLFVELLVIGFGALVWIGLLVAALLGYDVSQLWGHPLSLEALFPILSLSYVFGILTDRVADWTFECLLGRRHLNRVYGDEPGARGRYFDDRRTLIVGSKELWTFMEYGRSRLRICRGWVVNTVGFALSGNLYLAHAPGMPMIGWQYFVLLNAFLLIFGILCGLSWARLDLKEYKKIRRQAAWLRDEKKKGASVGQAASPESAETNQTERGESHEPDDERP